MNPFLCRLAAGDVPLLAAESIAGLIEAHEIPEPKAAEHPYLAGMRDRMRPQLMIAEGAVAVVPVTAALARRPSLWELASGRVEDTDAIRGLVEQASESSKVRGILLSVDSPGGFFTGGPELADAVAEAAKRKPIVAHVAGMGASLAYMVASQATRVVASPSSSVGSIGTFIVHADLTKMLERFGVKLEVFRNKDGTLKAPGVGGTELTEAQREHLQERADAAHSTFVQIVRRGRGRRVKPEAMRGQTFHGAEALAAGLVDFVGTEKAALRLVGEAADAGGFVRLEAGGGEVAGETVDSEVPRPGYNRLVAAYGRSVAAFMR